MSFFATRRFLPLFITQFFGAFNDNVLKNAIVMLITYRLASQVGDQAQLLVTLAAGLFILPFFLFSATAGQLADKYDRAKLTRLIKIAEIIIMLFATLGFMFEHISFLLVVLFAMGCHSTFFGPIKYALLPQHLNQNELLSGNGYIEAGTFLAILFGTILGGVLILQDNGPLWVCVALFACSIIGYASSRAIPVAAAPDPTLKISYNLAKETWRILRHSRDNHGVFLCILGISWFWLFGAVFLSEFAPFVRDILHGEPLIVTVLLILFSVGIGVGSLACNLLSKNVISLRYGVAAALGMSVFGIDIYFASGAFAHHDSNTVITVAAFLSELSGLRVAVDLFAIAICGGLFIVPLYAKMQHDSAPRFRARIIAANNVMNACFMVASALATIALLSLGASIAQIFLVVSLANLPMGVIIYMKLRSFLS